MFNCSEVNGPAFPAVLAPRRAPQLAELCDERNQPLLHAADTVLNSKLSIVNAVFAAAHTGRTAVGSLAVQAGGRLRALAADSSVTPGSVECSEPAEGGAQAVGHGQGSQSLHPPPPAAEEAGPGDASQPEAGTGLSDLGSRSLSTSERGVASALASLMRHELEGQAAAGNRSTAQGPAGIALSQRSVAVGPIMEPISEVSFGMEFAFSESPAVSASCDKYVVDDSGGAPASAQSMASTTGGGPPSVPSQPVRIQAEPALVEGSLPSGSALQFLKPSPFGSTLGMAGTSWSASPSPSTGRHSEQQQRSAAAIASTSRAPAGPCTAVAAPADLVSL